MQAIKGFKYNASTTGLTAHIAIPIDQSPVTQASVTLPDQGGFVHSRADNFNFLDIIMFDRAFSFAAGSFSVKDDAFDATAAVTIEGLNILHMITADRVTARIASSHPKNGAEPRITPIGSSFENLRIAGHRVEVDLAVDTFAEFDTASGLKAACADKSISGRVQPLVLNTLPSGELSCTLLRSIKGLGREIVVSGNTIRIRDFGVVHLAELVVGPKERRINMIRFELGSTPAGSGTAGGAAGNGSAD